MELYEAIRKRYSCRMYQDRPIEKDKLDRILDAARLAPSAKNLQDWRFVVVTDKTTRARMAEAANNQKWLAGATVIAACSTCRDSMRCGQPIAAIDVSIALEHIALAATAEGLATCWIGSFFPEKVREVLSIPNDVVIVELMAIGYPADKQPAPRRVKLDEIVSYEKWGF
jgi:nitroreductase